MEKEYDSLYQIIKEFAEEEKAVAKDSARPLVVDGKIMDQVKFETYRRVRQKYLVEIFEIAGFLEQFKFITSSNTGSSQKEVEYRIPKAQKVYVKFLLRQYSSAVSKAIRKNKLDEIKTEKVQEIFDELEKIINEHVPDADHEKELVNAYAITQLQSRTAFDKVEIGLLKLMGDDLSQIKLRPVSEISKDTRLSKSGEVLDKELRIGNDSDAAFLMYYYYHLLQRQSEIWNQIVDKVAELRFEEITENLENEGISPECAFRDIRAVVFEAKMRVHEERMDHLKKYNKPIDKQLEIVKKRLK